MPERGGLTVGPWLVLEGSLEEGGELWSLWKKGNKKTTTETQIEDHRKNMILFIRPSEPYFTGRFSRNRQMTLKPKCLHGGRA